MAFQAGLFFSSHVYSKRIFCSSLITSLSVSVYLSDLSHGREGVDSVPSYCVALDTGCGDSGRLLAVDWVDPGCLLTPRLPAVLQHCQCNFSKIIETVTEIIIICHKVAAAIY